MSIYRGTGAAGGAGERPAVPDKVLAARLAPGCPQRDPLHLQQLPGEGEGGKFQIIRLLTQVKYFTLEAVEVLMVRSSLQTLLMALIIGNNQHLDLSCGFIF